MNVRFREVQHFSQWWLILLVGFVVLQQWVGFFFQIILRRPWGNNPAPDWMMILLWLFIGLGLPLFFRYMRLMVTVNDKSVDIRFRPFAHRTIPLVEIEHIEVRTYHPVREFGGWGVRGLPGKRAYNVGGKRGVELTLKDDRKVMIGSEQADELATAITLAQGRQ